MPIAELAGRIRQLIGGDPGLTEKKMFGAASRSEAIERAVDLRLL